MSPRLRGPQPRTHTRMGLQTGTARDFGIAGRAHAAGATTGTTVTEASPVFGAAATGPRDAGHRTQTYVAEASTTVRSHTSMEHSAGIGIVGCRGVQVGEDNHQVNTFTFDVSRVEIDWNKVLGRRRVQSVLAQLAADPDNATLRSRADAELGRGSLFASAPRIDTGAGAAASSTEPVPGLLGLLFVRESTGLQVGDHNRQENAFVYTTGATLDARQVLNTRADVRKALIDGLVEGTTGTGALREAMSEAVSDAVLGHGAPRGLGTRAVPKAGVAMMVAGKDGVSVGHSCRQYNEAHVRGAEAAFPTRAMARAQRAAEHDRAVQADRAHHVERALERERALEAERRAVEALAAPPTVEPSLGVNPRGARGPRLAAPEIGGLGGL